jgi:hypothetical protein
LGRDIFRKPYASAVRYVRYRHESAYILAKGYPAKPVNPIDDVLDCPYTGNTLHPTQKPVEALLPVIQSFSRPNDIVLDPFCVSGSTLVAARRSGRRFIGCELEPNMPMPPLLGYVLSRDVKHLTALSCTRTIFIVFSCPTDVADSLPTISIISAVFRTSQHPFQP